MRQSSLSICWLCGSGRKGRKKGRALWGRIEGRGLHVVGKGGGGLRAVCLPVGAVCLSAVIVSIIVTLPTHTPRSVSSLTLPHTLPAEAFQPPLRLTADRHPAHTPGPTAAGTGVNPEP